jgi:putative ABC transport system permease protein
MMRHLLKLVWRRKRASALIMVEIFLSFLVVFVVATLGLYFAGNWRRPLGYDWHDVWLVRVTPDVEIESLEARLAHRDTVERLAREIRGMPGVAAAAAINLAPYDDHRWDSTQDLTDGRSVGFDVNHATVAVPDVLRMRIERGRWFEDADGALGWEPVVLSASMAREIFGTDDPLGRGIEFKDHEGKEQRVVGVIADFRKEGELAPHRNYLFRPVTATAVTLPQIDLRNVLVRVEAGTPAAFEEALVRRLEALQPSWTFETRTLEEMRESYLRSSLVPFLLMGTIAGFLMLMVALGLTGVLWQNVTQRRQEIGLRRAVGAAARRIHRQVLMELMLMTSFAVLLGLLLVLQLPAVRLDVIRIEPGVLVAGSAVAAATIYLLAALCGWYPSWLATRIHPVEALRSE